MRIFTPVGGEPSLMVGMPDFEDSTIFFITQAADIRADNMQILGDFVLRGEQIAKGRTKLGWCAIIDGNISIGYDKERNLRPCKRQYYPEAIFSVNTV